MRMLAFATAKFFGVCILESIALSCALSSAAEGRSASIEDFGTQVGLSSAVISSDGKTVAVVSSRADYEGNRFTRSLVLVDVATGAHRVVPGTERSSVSTPRWSPDGHRLAWLASREGDQTQIYVMAVNEEGARAVRVTNTADGVGTNTVGGASYAWSPNGESLAYVSAEPGVELQGAERHNKSFEVVDNDYLATEPPRSFHVWAVSSGGGEPKRLTSGRASAISVEWARDGNTVVVPRQPNPHNSPLDFAEFMHNSAVSTTLESIDVSSGRQRSLATGPVRIMAAPVSSPDGRNIAFVRFRGREPWNRVHDLAVVSSAGGPVRDISSDLDRDVQEFAWVPGGDTLLLTAPDGTRKGLWRQPLDASPRQRLDLGPVIDLDDLTLSQKGSLAFIGRESRRPAEIYVMDSLTDKPRRLTRFNEHIAALELGHSQTVKWQLDGFNETGVLRFPPNFQKNRKYPLVLNIHGGPEGTSTEAFDLFDQVLAGKGWVVFKPNYRGSNSQGEAFQTAVVKDPGDGPGRDVMAGLAAVKALGFVDDSRVAVSGWSYGGFMTAWLIGHYQGWSSAVAGAPLTTLLDWYNLSCCNAWADPVLGGSPWLNQNFQNYLRWSPVTYAERVKTPTLILQNMGDPEVPYTGSYHFYHALRDNNVPVQFILYPIQGHGYNGDPVHQRDTLRRWIAWIDEHFKKPSPASQPVVSPASTQ